MARLHLDGPAPPGKSRFQFAHRWCLIRSEAAVSEGIGEGAKVTSFRRLALVISLVLFGLVAAPMTVSALGEGGTSLPAGNYHFTTLRASYSFFSSDPSQPQISIFPSATTQIAKPKVGPPTVTQETEVSIQISGETVNAGGCFVIGPSDFTVSSGLQSAALHTTITELTPMCPDFPGSVPTPFTLDVTWTGTGPGTSERGTSRFDCLTYSAKTQSVGTSNNASATATLAPLFTDSFTTQGGISSNDQVIHAQGAIQSACPPAIPARGVGSGFQAAGNYHFTSQQAGANFSSESGPQVGIFLRAGSSKSNPKVGPSTVTTDSSMIIQISSDTVNGVQCFVLTPSNFSIRGVQSAALHVTVTEATPTCFPSFGFIPLPLTLDVTWTGTGPTATRRDVSQFGCLNYSTESQIVNVTNNANVTATVTPLFTDTFTTGQGSLDSGDFRVHAQGVFQQQACFG